MTKVFDPSEWQFNFLAKILAKAEFRRLPQICTASTLIELRLPHRGLLHRVVLLSLRFKCQLIIIVVLTIIPVEFNPILKLDK